MSKSDAFFESQLNPLPESLVLGGESSKSVHSDGAILMSDETSQEYSARRREDIRRPPYSQEKILSIGVFGSKNTRMLW
jgi:hypothetical protein